MNLGFYVLLTVSFSLESLARNTKLKEAYSWKTLDYAFPNETVRASAIQSNKFIPENNLPIGLDVWKKKLFITVPRWRDGIVSSLNYIDMSGGEKSNQSPALIPYPSFEANELQENCSGTCITSAFRVRVDACDRLWVIDFGKAKILEEDNDGIEYSKPQILIYNLQNDELIKKFVFSKNLIGENAFFNNIIVDCPPDKCNDAFAYITDIGSFALVVYDFRNEKAWRIKHNFFYLDPKQGNYKIGGQTFHWSDGLFGLALTGPKRDGSKTAFFHACSSTTLFKVNTFTLQDENEGKESNYTAYSIVGDKGPNSQTTASFIHEPTGVMFYGQINKNAIYCWKTDKEFKQENLQKIASNSKTMIFPSDLKVDYQENLWVLTDKFAIYSANKLDAEEVNFRIFVTTVANAIKDTACAS